MKERQQLKAQLAINNAKITTLRAYADQYEKAIFKLAEDLARDGYSQAEITEAIEAIRPDLQEDIAKLEAAVEVFFQDQLMVGQHG